MFSDTTWDFLPFLDDLGVYCTIGRVEWNKLAQNGDQYEVFFKKVTKLKVHEIEDVPD
jgi:hypothetical protein